MAMAALLAGAVGTLGACLCSTTERGSAVRHHAYVRYQADLYRPEEHMLAILCNSLLQLIAI